MPVRLPDTIAVREKLPAGAVAVLINRNHTYSDLYLPIDPRQAEWLSAIDGQRSIAEITSGREEHKVARTFFRRLWNYDQVVFDTSQAPAGPATN